MSEEQAFLQEYVKKLQQLIRDYERFVRNLDNQAAGYVIPWRSEFLGLLARTDQLIPDKDAPEEP